MRREIEVVAAIEGYFTTTKLGLGRANDDEKTLTNLDEKGCVKSNDRLSDALHDDLYVSAKS